MKYGVARLVISILFIVFLVGPAAVSGSTIPDVSEYEVAYPPEIQPFDTAATTSPPVIVSDASIKSTSAVYIDEQNPSAKHNALPFSAHLRVGISPEFGGEMWTLISFSPIEESDGGPVPDDAVIRGAKLRLYKESGDAGTVKVYRLTDSFNENTVTWDTKPGKWATAEGTKSVPAANGWVEIDIADEMVTNAVNFNRPVRIAICPTWSDIGRDISFHSDENPSLGPILIVSYEGEAPPPEPTPPSPPEGDTTPCTIEYTVSPSHPHVGEPVTITITARDDQAMYYLALSRGYEELGRIDATTGQRELNIVYTEAATLPSLSYIITADDLGEAPPVGETISVPVIGSGTPPEVTVTADWEIERVVPEEYQLIKNDGQTVTITATATDPDGIDLMSIFINGIAHDYRYSGETSVSETLVWTNNEPTRTRFSYYAGARDEEGAYVTAEGGDYTINHPEDIRFIWSAALGFVNPSTPTIPWERMVQIFGSGECWNVESWGWRDPSADRFYEDNVRTSCDGGECFGMSTTATEIYHGRISPSELEFPLIAKQLSDANSFTREYVQARQGGQMGEEVQVPRHNQDGVGVMEILSWIEDDLENDDPGVLDIWEGSSGHAVVPWMTRHMPDGTVRIYIYDCNRVTGIRNPTADFHNTSHYPYIVFDDSGWSYQWSSTSVWNDDIDYINYRDACGDMNQLVSPSLGTDAPLLTDHDIPTASDFWHGVVGGDVDVYFEDEEGNITGIYNGEIREEIPGSMAVIIPMGSPFSEHESYILPMDKKLSIHAVGQQEGEYNLSLIGNNSLFSIQKKRILPGSEDELSISPAELLAIGHVFRVQPDTPDDNFRVMIAISFAGLVTALDSEEVEREYGMEEVSASEDSDFAVHVEEGGGTLVIDNYGDGIEFDTTMRSTESADSIDPNEELPYIPSSTEEDITLNRGQRLEATPDDWATADEKGSLHTLKKKAEGGGGNVIPFIPIVIGVVVVVAIAGGVVYFIRKGAIGKSA